MAILCSGLLLLPVDYVAHAMGFPWSLQYTLFLPHVLSTGISSQVLPRVWDPIQVLQSSSLC